MLVDLDAGEDVSMGVTSSRYGVQGWPTTIVIDQRGNIVYNSNEIDTWPPEALLSDLARGRGERATTGSDEGKSSSA